MERIRNMIFIILYIAVTASCENTTEEEKKDLYNLIGKNNYKLSLDSITSVRNSFIFHYQKNKSQEEYFYLLNKNKNIVHIYDVKNNQTAQKIILQTEGPNGVGQPEAIYGENKDSIFVLSPFHYKLFLINSLGQIINKYSLLDQGIRFNEKSLSVPQGDFSVLTSGGNDNYIYKFRSNLVFGAYPNLNYATEDYFKKGKSGLILNLNDNKIRYVMDYPHTYLEAFQKKFRFPAQFIFTSQACNVDSNLCVISYPADKYLYVVDLNTTHVSKFETPSRYFTDIKLMSRQPTTPEKDFMHTVENHSYGRVYYDRFRKVYLRYALHPNPLKKDKFDSQPYLINSIIILDYKFNKIGETILDKTYQGGFVFFREDGIYLQKVVKDEDYVHFTRFELVKSI